MDYIAPVSRSWVGRGRGTRLARVLLLISALKGVEASGFLDLGASGKLHVPVKRQASSDQAFNWSSVCLCSGIMRHIEYADFERVA